MSKSAQATAAEVDVNQVQVALPKLENLASNLLQQTGVPGMAIAVVYQDQVVFLKGLGVREAGKSAAVDPAKEHFVESSKDILSHETGEDSSRILDWI